jgi:hypothetical protein
LVLEQLVEPSFLCREGFFRWRNAHQTTQFEARQLGNFTRQRERLVRRDAAFACLIAQTDLKTDLQSWGVEWPLVVQSNSDALTI